MNDVKEFAIEHEQTELTKNSVPSVPSVPSCKQSPSAPLRLCGEKPRKVLVPLATGLSWPADPDYIYQEKLDGRFETRRARGKLRPIGDTILAGEYLQGAFHAFDLLQLSGEDCRDWPLRERLTWLDEVFQCEPLDHTGGGIHRVLTHWDGSTLLRNVLERGGEGIVRKRLDSPWGTPMEACKRLETFTCIVTALNAGQSVQISLLHRRDAETQRPEHSESLRRGASGVTPCGSVALKGGKCDQVRIGSLIKVEGFGLTRAGQIREPRPCKDTATNWLIQY